MTESYLRRWAISATLPRSLAATISTSAPDCFTARKKLRPIRPKPLTPTRMVIGVLPPGVAVDVEPHPIRSGRRPPTTGPLPRYPGGSAVDVAVGDPQVEALLAQRPGHGFGDGHRAVAAASAAERHRQVRLPLGDVGGQEHGQQRVDLGQEVT